MKTLSSVGYLCLLLISGQHCMAQTLKNSRFPAHVEQLKFTKIKEDTVRLIKEFTVFDGSDIKVGRISGINIAGDNVFLADYKLGKVIVIGKNDFKFRNIIGTGTGVNNSGLNSPSGVLIFKNNLLIPQYMGENLFTEYTMSGDFVKEYKRPAGYFGYSPDPQNVFLIDSTYYFSNVIAWDLGKVAKAKLSSSVLFPGKHLVPVTDFEPVADSATLRVAITRLFLNKASNNQRFYASSGNKPLLNIYTNDGKLIKSIDLRSINVLKTYYEDLFAFFGQGDAIGFPEGKAGTLQFFASVIEDDNGFLYYKAGEITNIKDIIANKVTRDKATMKLSVVALNPETLKYRVYHFPNNRFMPLKIVGNQMWGVDEITSAVSVYQLSQ